MISLIAMVICSIGAAVLCEKLVLRSLPRAIAQLIEVEKPMTEIDPHQGPRGEKGETGADGAKEPLSRVFVILLVATGIVVGIGVQSLLYQRATDRQDQARERHDVTVETCLQTWADDYKATTDIRVGSNAALRDAERQWNLGVDGVFQAVIKLAAVPDGEQPSPQLITEFTDALAAYSQAQATLLAAQEEVDQTAADNPYPKLELNCSTGREAVQ